MSRGLSRYIIYCCPNQCKNSGIQHCCDLKLSPMLWDTLAIATECSWNCLANMSFTVSLQFGWPRISPCFRYIMPLKKTGEVCVQMAGLWNTRQQHVSSWDTQCEYEHAQLNRMQNLGTHFTYHVNFLYDNDMMNIGLYLINDQIAVTKPILGHHRLRYGK